MYCRCGFRYERNCARSVSSRIAGIDEAGLGALAGPVVAAARNPAGKIPASEIKRLETAAAGVASGNLR